MAGEPKLRLIVGFLAATTFVEGAIDVLVVVAALELLDVGAGGVGWLNAAWGVGGLVGGAVALGVLRRGRHTFVSSVTNNPRSVIAADDVIEARLAPV